MEVVSEVVMAGDAFATRATTHGMVALPVTEAMACWTRPVLGVKGKPKPIPSNHDKFLRPEVEAQGGAGHDIEPVTCMGESQRLEPCHLLRIAVGYFSTDLK